MQQVEAGTVEVTELESWLDVECPCEAIHTRTACSVLVVARATWCEPSLLICQSSAVATLDRMSWGVLCAECKRPAKDCWRIIPI